MIEQSVPVYMLTRSLLAEALIRQDVERTLDLGVLMETRERERREQVEVQEKLDVVNQTLLGAFGLDEEGAR
jgi:hypothetical protein